MLIAIVGLLQVGLVGHVCRRAFDVSHDPLPGWMPAERYPWLVLLFLSVLAALLGMLMDGVLHHWRWRFWPMLMA